MKERPILFNGPMVRAVLSGSKTQTRRIVKPQPSDHHWSIGIPGYALRMTGPTLMGNGRIGVRFHHTIPQNREWDSDPWNMCPYGQPGDRLWVREAHAMVPATAYRMSDGVTQTIDPEDSDTAYIYREGFDRSTGGLRWRPSIHMPRWASRITLEIVSVRVERLQDISEADASDEGCGFLLSDYPQWDGDPDLYRKLYRSLWETINGPDSWAANPWVWVIEFRRLS